jgi:Protein of unknown function (DUF2867)
MSNISSPQETSIPNNCSLYASARSADFADAFSTLVPCSELTALQLYGIVTRSTPGWVDSAMRARNRVVRLFGLKDLGNLSDVPMDANPSLQAGQRIGIFKFVSATPNELVLKDTDKHLSVHIAVIKQKVDAATDRIVVCTVVQTHKLLGKLYMLPVGPAHKRIVPAILRRAPAAVAQAIKLQSAATIGR